MEKTIILTAGGTGGHLFPAQALATELVERGWTVHLATDDRAERFTASFPAKEIHIIPSATLSSKNPLKLIGAAFTLLMGYLKSRSLVSRLKPKVVVGFGGYPTIPPMLAARHKGVPTVLHEANAVLGRANRFLAKSVKKIAMGVKSAASGLSAHIHTGNPVRDAIHDAAERDYEAHQADGAFRLLVFGGSQGAQFFSSALPDAIGKLSESDRARLEVVQQARPEDEASLKSAYEALGVSQTVATFFSDMHEHLASAHFVIARAGASTVSELAIVGRPSLLVPYPFALDHDQAANAEHLATSGGAVLSKQADLSAEKLAEILKNALDDPAKLALAAESAKKAGVPDASKRLADLVETASL
ncbi:MAG: undecaprenyldiphospho-muramoylpentapeptide beta-N-acetylglucosaminyltransferase [Pseudomonadota bacterium]